MPSLLMADAWQMKNLSRVMGANYAVSRGEYRLSGRIPVLSKNWCKKRGNGDCLELLRNGSRRRPWKTRPALCRSFKIVAGFAYTVCIRNPAETSQLPALIVKEEHRLRLNTGSDRAEYGCCYGRIIWKWSGDKSILGSVITRAVKNTFLENINMEDETWFVTANNKRDFRAACSNTDM